MQIIELIPDEVEEVEPPSASAANDGEIIESSVLLENQKLQKIRMQQGDNQYDLEIKEAYDATRRAMQEELVEIEERKRRRQELIRSALRERKAVSSSPQISLFIG
jgi:hypothetical protein